MTTSSTSYDTSAVCFNSPSVEKEFFFNGLMFRSQFKPMLNNANDLGTIRKTIKKFTVSCVPALERVRSAFQIPITTNGNN